MLNDTILKLFQIIKKQIILIRLYCHVRKDCVLHLLCVLASSGALRVSSVSSKNMSACLFLPVRLLITCTCTSDHLTLSMLGIKDRFCLFQDRVKIVKRNGIQRKINIYLL